MFTKLKIKKLPSSFNKVLSPFKNSKNYSNFTKRTKTFSKFILPTICATTFIHYYSNENIFLCKDKEKEEKGLIDKAMDKVKDTAIEKLEEREEKLNEKSVTRSFGLKTTTFFVSGLAGFVSGYCITKVGKYMFILAGLTFVGVKYLDNQGYIDVHWSKFITKDTISTVYNHKDTAFSLYNIITKNNTTTFGFAIGLILGIII